MSDYGFIVTKEGHDVSEGDIRNQILHSDHSMFKYNSTLTGDIVIASGGSTGTLEVTHGLGYTPAFLVYENNSLFPADVDCYADSTKIKITKNLAEPYNQTIDTYTVNDVSYAYIPVGSTAAYAGKYLGSSINSAFRFSSIDLNQGQTITEARFYLEHLAGISGADTLFKVYGLDEDDTGDFSGGYPGGRAKTSASLTKSQSPLSQWGSYNDDFTAMAQEIVNRSGWSNGNHMGFVFEDNGTTDNKFMYTSFSPNASDITLKITITGTGSITYSYKVVVFKDKIV